MRNYDRHTLRIRGYCSYTIHFAVYNVAESLLYLNSTSGHYNFHANLLGLSGEPLFITTASSLFL